MTIVFYDFGIIPIHSRHLLILINKKNRINRFLI